MFAGIEAGGTKFVVAAGTGPDDMSPPVVIPTSASDPDETMEEVVRCLHKLSAERRRIEAIGIGSFGPVDLRSGTITTTPKLAWQNFPFLDRMKQRFPDIPVAFDTDVNAAALGEGVWGSGQGLEDFVYITVGTGIGGGSCIHGNLVHGAVHPEMGHLWVPRHPEEDPTFRSVCPWHSSCWEGLASGPSIEGRWGTAADRLPENHPAWKLESWYIAHALTAITYVQSPQRVVLGGGVMRREHLFPLIRRQVDHLLGGYLPRIAETLETYLVPPRLKWPGVLGAIELARRCAVRIRAAGN